MPRSREPNQDLTPAELQVVELLAKYGWGNNELAAHLVISRRTIESHIASALSKSNSKNRVQLVLWFQKL